MSIFFIFFAYLFPREGKRVYIKFCLETQPTLVFDHHFNSENIYSGTFCAHNNNFFFENFELKNLNFISFFKFDKNSTMNVYTFDA